MLKIKKEIDLKELEKFGFKYENGKYYIESIRKPMPSEKYSIKKHLAYSVYSKTRQIKMYRNNISWEYDSAMDLIYDLIEAGFVEKVEVKENEKKEKY